MSTQMNEKHYSNTAYKKIDCIHFAISSLYSVNTAPVCIICRLRLYCFSFTVHEGDSKCLIPCSYEKNLLKTKVKYSDINGRYHLRFLFCFIVTMQNMPWFHMLYDVYESIQSYFIISSKLVLTQVCGNIAIFISFSDDACLLLTEWIKRLSL